MTLDINAVPTRKLREHHRQQLIQIMERIYEEKQYQLSKGRLKQASFDRWEDTVIDRRTIQQIGDNNLRGRDLESCTIYWIFDQVMHCPRLKKTPLWDHVSASWAQYALMGQRVYDDHFPPEEEQGRISPLDDLLNRSR